MTWLFILKNNNVFLKHVVKIRLLIYNEVTRLLIYSIENQRMPSIWAKNEIECFIWNWLFQID